MFDCSHDPNNSSSLTQYFSSNEFKNCYAYATATQPSGENCSSAAPNPAVDASHTKRVSKCRSKCLFCVISDTNFSMFLNAVLCSVDHSSGLFFSVFLVTGVKRQRSCQSWNVPCEVMYGIHKIF